LLGVRKKGENYWKKGSRFGAIDWEVDFTGALDVRRKGGVDMLTERKARTKEKIWGF